MNYKLNAGLERLWEDIGLWRFEENTAEALLTLEGEHWILRTVILQAVTDYNDTLTSESVTHMFARNIKERTGNIFYLEDIQSNDAIVIISEAPDYCDSVLSVKKGMVTLKNEGNAVVVGCCKRGECEYLTREYYRRLSKGRRLLTMSNTWGDLHQWSRVCNDFVLGEIDAALELGVDIVQIDDGWQRGCTGDEAIFDERRRRMFKGDFWKLNEEKFQNGMKAVTEYAKERGIRMGLWFAPDSHGEYELLERDKAVLKKAYEEWGIRFFKLDMFWVESRQEQKKIMEFLRYIYSFGDDVAVQLDVTNGVRLGYLCSREYGTIFVENRYTGSGNSFPHRILRNLWMLSRYLPTSRFQFEVVNPTLNIHKYSDNDPFAPINYDMDYLFASVMLSNPLFWMEMQFLPKDKRRELARIMPLWKRLREELSVADVQPIGDTPSGCSFTGFSVSLDGKIKYLLLFREVTDTDTYDYRINMDLNAKVKILSSNAVCNIEVGEKITKVNFSKPRSYVLAEVKYEGAV